MKRRFSDLKLKYKISFTMIPLLTVLALVIGISCGIYFFRLYSIDTENSINSWFDVTYLNLEHHISQISSRLLSAVSATKTQDTYQNFKTGVYSKLTAQAEFQDSIRNLKNLDYLISDAYILDDKNNVFLLYSSAIYDIKSPLLDYDTFSKLSGISIQEETESPFAESLSVIPVSFPISSLSPTSYLMLSQETEPEIILVLLFKARELEFELNRSTSQYFDSYYRLYFKDKSIFNSENSPYTLSSSYQIAEKRETSVKGLEIAMLVNKAPMQNKSLSILLFSFILCIAVASFGTFLILYFATFLTRPFAKLSRMISEIKKNTYKLDEKPSFNDETGELIESINSMYVTIQRQIERIKKDEEEKYHYMEQILTEQINPHFIYNTLELINMEVLNGDIESASSMIQAFAKYLRYSLNKGNNLITFKEEGIQINSYMDIMNRRLNKKISFSFTYSKSLENIMIPKSILQPLVENSIKHGFKNISEQQILLPEITIKAQDYDSYFEILVIDNGLGIDYDRFYSSLEKGYESVGLNNIKRRLELCFGKVDIIAESIPFYRNTVRITVYTD